MAKTHPRRAGARLSKETRARLELAATVKGVTVSQYLRGALEARLARDIGDEPVDQEDADGE